MKIDYNSPSALKALLEERGLAMQKKFGQNFLVNPHARKEIVSLLELSEGDLVWEIGPGIGNMTGDLLASGARLSAFEIDRGFIATLHDIFAEEEASGRFTIIEGNVLKTWRKAAQDTAAIKLFGNLPYNIAASFIADTICCRKSFARCVFTVQKEVAERMYAAPTTKAYSSFSVLCQWLYDISGGIELAPGNFWPRPNVASKAVLFVPKQKPFSCSNPQLFVKLVHTLFSQRRKTIVNNIKALLPSGVSGRDFLKEAGISETERAENLPVSDFILLSEMLNSVTLSKGLQDDAGRD